MKQIMQFYIKTYKNAMQKTFVKQLWLSIYKYSTVTESNI